MKDIQDIKIGLIGGGQLGKMILSEANRMNLKTLVLDSNKNSPCKNLCNKDDKCSYFIYKVNIRKSHTHTQIFVQSSKKGYHRYIFPHYPLSKKSK